MNKLLFFLLCFLFSFSIYGSQEYLEPQEVATTEGLPSSLINQSVCAISGEYTDSILDVVLPGPEPLTISRVYTSFSNKKPWSFNHYDQLVVGSALYDNSPVYIVGLQQPSGAQLDYIFEKKEGYLKLKKVPFKLLLPKGLTNGASVLSGKTNIKNQTLHFYPDEEMIVAQSGAGNRKTFKKVGQNQEGWPICGQVFEEKVNGSQIRYEGKAKGIIGVSEIICENKETKQRYSSVKFSDKSLGQDLYLQTLLTSDGRKLDYFFKHHHYKVKEKSKNAETSYPVDRFYLSKVDHPYAPSEKYTYEEKALSRDMHITAKLRDGGRQFLNIDYYHTGKNTVGGEVGVIDIKNEDDFRLDRVKKLRAPVGTNQNPITTHRFDYHATIKKHKRDGHKKIAEGYTDVYDAENHKTRYFYDEEHRLTSIVRYTGIDSSTYAPYTEECFFWNKEGWLLAKIFKDGLGHVHHARTFVYDSYGNVLTSNLCGKLTGNPAPPLLLDSDGNLIENGYERETKTYTYSNDGLNLCLTETDAAGKTIRYEYKKNSDRLKAKYVSYEGKIRLREFYSYDSNHALEQKILDDGCAESSHDLSFVTERHYIVISTRKEAPIGLPNSMEELAFDFQTNRKVLLKRSHYVYSPEGRLCEQQVFDANHLPAYLLQWDYDLHGNLISETNALGMTTKKKYDPATDNLVEQSTTDIRIVNSYDFANRLIEQKEIHPDQTIVTSRRFDYLNNCQCTMDPYGHATHQCFDDFGRVIEIHSPPIFHDGVLKTAVLKKSYDIAGFPISLTNANGDMTFMEVNIRGQPTKVIYPDGTREEMIYSLDGKLLQKIAKNGTRTEYTRDPLGRVVKEIIYSKDGIKQTLNRYNAFHLLESTDEEGDLTIYSYDSAGRLKETVKNERKTQQFYDSLGRISEIREYYGNQPHEYRATVKKYDNLDQIKEEHLQTADGETLHCSFYEYDSRGNRTLAQTGDQKMITQYNTRNQPITIIDGLGHQTHIEYDDHFINPYGQRVLQKTITDPLGYRTIETYDIASRLVETIHLNLIGEKIARQAFYYDLVGNQTKVEEEVIEQGKVKQNLITLFAYNAAGKVTQITEAAGTPEQKISRIRYNAFGQKEALIKPDGKEIRYTYDGFERLKTLSSSDKSISYLYEYNLVDQITKVTDQNSRKATKREYFQGELKKETLANDLSLDYTYDRTGRARTILFPDKSGVEYVYNAVDLKEIHRIVNAKRIYTHLDLEHSLSGQVIKSQLPGQGGVATYDFDVLGQCISIESEAFNQRVPSNGFDAAGNLLQFEIQNTLCEFTYDDYYQVKSEKGKFCHQYSFDSLANRTSKNEEKYDHNALNQLIKKGDKKLLYDLNGNLIRNGSCEYAYDALDRLIKVTCQGKVITYSYDAFNRRITKKVNGQEDYFLYQGLDEIGRWKNGVCQELRLLGKNKQNRSAVIEINKIPYASLHDISGSIACLVNLQGEVIEEYRYSVYGEREIFSPLGEKRLCSLIGNPWQYAGKRIEEESGLIAFGMRDYDPNLGRWITPDPIGFADGSNLYAYVHNNPLQNSDAFGLYTCSPIFDMGCAYYNHLESKYEKFCIPLGFGEFCDPQPILHINIEDNFAKDYNFRKKQKDPLFNRTRTYCANDFIDPKTDKNYNFKPMPRNKKILFVNGIDNNLSDFEKSLVHLAELVGYNVEGIFCPTFGMALDMICYKHALQDYTAYEGTRELQRHIQEFHATTPFRRTMMVIPHSRGAVYTRNGMMDSSEELRQRVEIRAIACGAYIERRLCKNVIHYESQRDVVPLLDYSGRQRCKDTIITLDPHKNAPCFDHKFTSPTYAAELKFEMDEYLGG